MDKGKRSAHRSRRSLSSLFDDLDIKHPSRDSSPSKSKPANALRGTFSEGWPSWNTISRGKKHVSRRVPFTLKLDTAHRYSTWVVAANKVEDEQPEGNMAIAVQLMEEIGEMVTANNLELELEESTMTGMAYAIFGSNRIEKVGMDVMETVRLCMLVFKGEALGEYEERSEEYQERLEKFLARGTEAGDAVKITRTRREVVQHALAFQYMVEAFVQRDEPLTEELILRTHAIMCDKIESASGHSSEKYAGMYRQKDAFAGTTRFTKPSDIRGAMASLIKSLNDDIAEAEKTQSLDPFMMAAKYCDRFVNVHPFADGNGRVCRLILNSILLKYGGIVLPIGEHDTNRDRYLQIAMRSGQAGGYPGELGTMVLEGAVRTLRRLKVSLLEALKRGGVGGN
jgi:Fic family protein